MLIRVNLPLFFPFPSKLSSTLKLVQFLSGLSYSDELGGKLKVFLCIFYTKALKKKDALLKPYFDSLTVVVEKKLKKQIKALVLSFHLQRRAAL